MSLVDEALINKYGKYAWQTIHRNRRLIKALRLEDDDVFQELMITAIKAIQTYDSKRDCPLDRYVSLKMQFRILDFTRRQKPHGITALKDRRLSFQSLDFVPEDGTPFEIPINDDVSSLELTDAFTALTQEEREAVRLKYEGHAIRKARHKRALKSAQSKILERNSIQW